MLRNKFTVYLTSAKEYTFIIKSQLDGSNARKAHYMEFFRLQSPKNQLLP